MNKFNYSAPLTARQLAIAALIGKYIAGNRAMEPSREEVEVIYRTTLEYLYCGNKVAAIKYFRDATKIQRAESIVWLHKNTFSTWLDDHGIKSLDYIERLGSKEAKDVIDWIFIVDESFQDK